MSETMSIVIPVYNRAKELPRTVASILAQHYRPIHLILVDNNSTDNSLDICHWLQQKYSKGLFTIDVLQETKRGASAARNKGLKHVNTRHVMFFDSDDTLHPDAVMLYMEAFSIHPEIDIVGCTINFCNEQKKVWQAKAVFSTDPVQHLLHSTLSTQRFAARTEVIRAVGGWEEDYNGWVDWNLGVRLLLHTSKVHWIKHPPLATQYLHANSITTQNDRKGLEQFHLALLATRRDIEASQHPQRKRYDRLVVYRQVLLASHIIKLARQQHNPELYQYGQQLYHEALHDNATTPFLRIFFTSCFYFTLWGGRGTGLIAQYIIR